MFYDLSQIAFIHTVTVLFKTSLRIDQYTQFFSFNLATNFDFYSFIYTFIHSVNIYGIKIHLHTQLSLLRYNMNKK